MSGRPKHDRDPHGRRGVAAAGVGGMMRFLELFAGAGGLSMGLEAAGMACVGHAEIEPHARAVLRYAWRDVPLYGDVSQLNGADLMAAHPFDVLTGGSPCQDLSVAGKRAGLAGSRSSLFHVQHRLWVESGAPYLIWENVAGAFSSNGGADFATVLSTLVGAAVPVPADGWRRGGVASGPDAVAAWRVLDLQYVSGRDRAAPPQRRVRVFVLAARTGGVDPAEVLALGESVCGHPAPRRRAGEGAAGHPAGGVRGGGVVPLQEVGKRTGVSTTDRRAGIGIGDDASEDGTVPRTPIVTTYSVPAIGHIREDDVASCITANTGGGGETQNPAFVVVASGQVSNVTNPTFDGAPSLTCLHEAPIVVGTLDAHDAVKWGSHQWVDQGKAMLTGGRPRRLTPLECERLMAWPDMHTAVGIDEQGREYRLSDTARYRLCGNGVGSTCTEWIGRRLMALEAMAQASERQGAA